MRNITKLHPDKFIPFIVLERYYMAIVDFYLYLFHNYSKSSIATG
nr:MAG TPA: hypothetical protein [Caudoviricetes sp.]